MCSLAGGDILPHRAAVRQPDVQDGAGRLSTQHGPQLGSRVQEVAEACGKRQSKCTHSSLYRGEAVQTQWWHQSRVAGSTSGGGKSLGTSRCSAEMVPRGRGYGNGVWAVSNPLTGPQDQQRGLEEGVKAHTGGSRLDHSGGAHLTQVWSRLSFHMLCSVCLFRSGLCGVWRGPHVAQQRFQYFQSFECNKDEEEGGANRDAAAKQPGWVWVCTTL